MAIAHFRCYLHDKVFMLVIDHQPLKWLMESDKLPEKLAWWALMLMMYDLKVVHRAGLVNMDVATHLPTRRIIWALDGMVSVKLICCLKVFLSLLAMHRDTIEKATVATVDENEGEESGGARDIYKDRYVMPFLKDGEAVSTWSYKERD